MTMISSRIYSSAPLSMDVFMIGSPAEIPELQNQDKKISSTILDFIAITMLRLLLDKFCGKIIFIHSITLLAKYRWIKDKKDKILIFRKSIIEKFILWVNGKVTATF